MIGLGLLLGLLAIHGDVPTAPVGRPSILSIDPCVGIDEATLHEVLALELFDAPTDPQGFPDSVEVRCQGERLEMRVGSYTAPARRLVRTFQLAPVLDTPGLLARQARSREIALAIAELLRRHDMVQDPPSPLPTPPPTTAPSVSLPGQSTSQAAAEKTERWQVGFLTTYDTFAGGQRFIGGDLTFAARFGSRFMAALQLGGRAGPQHIVPNGRHDASAAIAGATAGILSWPGYRRIDLAWLFHAQGYLVRTRLEAPANTDTRTTLSVAYVLAAGPRLTMALGRRFALGLGLAVGAPPHGIVLRVQGAKSESLTGLFLSGHLAGVFRF